MYDRIIVPVDERDGQEALMVAWQLARRLDAGLTLLHVHHALEAPPELEGLPQYRYQHVVETWDGRDADEEAHEIEWLARKAAALAADAPDVPVTSRVVHAPLARALRREGERVMVVAPAGRELSPAVGEVLRAGGVPVLLVGAERVAGVGEIRRVLVALDGSRFSEEVLPPAMELADALGVGITLLEVVTRHRGLTRLLHPGERSAGAAEAWLRGVRDRIADGRSVDVRVIEATDPAAALILVVERVDGGVLALATHGRGGLRRMIMGSVAERVVAGTQRPVLVFRPTGVRSPSAPEPATT